ncbi:hypothetical protein [Calothrix sp. NIES-2098]|uniref:hypothetical protein n=1 Tax=Calothrix sp. NIES-2098 TaxID=1954171 RepID=UPI0030D975D0
MLIRSQVMLVTSGAASSIGATAKAAGDAPSKNTIFAHQRKLALYANQSILSSKIDESQAVEHLKLHGGRTSKKH